MSEPALKKADPPPATEPAVATKPKAVVSIPKIPKGIFPKIKWSIVAIKISTVELFKALFSKDAPTKKMAALFFGSIVALVSVSISASRYFKERGQKVTEHALENSNKGQGFAEYVAKERKEADVQAARLEIGKFVVELIPLSEEKGRSGGSMNLAEVMIVIECDNGTTCNTIKSQLVQVRSEITNVFVPIDRQVLMTTAGKNNIKNQIRQRINEWLKSGRVDSVYITDFIIG